MTGALSDMSSWILFSHKMMILAVLLSFFLKSPWKTAMLLTCALIATPVNSALYCGVYLFVPVVLFLNEKKHTAFDWVYTCLFILILNPAQILLNDTPLMGVLADSTLLVLYCMLLSEAVWAVLLQIPSVQRWSTALHDSPFLNKPISILPRRPRT